MNTAYEDWARHFMWERLLDCESPSRLMRTIYADKLGLKQHEVNLIVGEDYKKAKEKMHPRDILLDHCTNPPMIMYNQTMCPEAYGVKETENTMGYNCAQATVTAVPARDEAKDYLERRLQAIRWTKRNELYKEFSVDGFYPKSIKELKTWLKEANYRIHETKSHDEDEEDEEYTFFDWSDAFRWGKTKPDKKAFKAAIDKLEEAYQNTCDTISIVTDEEKRLAALKEFESFTVR